MDWFFEKPVATTLDWSLSGPGTIPRLPKAVQSSFLPKKAKKLDWTGLLNSNHGCYCKATGEGELMSIQLTSSRLWTTSLVCLDYCVECHAPGPFLPLNPASIVPKCSVEKYKMSARVMGTRCDVYIQFTPSLMYVLFSVNILGRGLFTIKGT